MTTQEIYDSIIAEKESGNYPQLDELNSTSKVSIWRLWVWIFSFFSKAIYELFVSHKAYMEDYFSKQQANTVRWWIDQIKKFQYGDALVFLANKYQYTTIDFAKQIVKRVALTQSGSITLFKVAKIDNEVLTPLNSSEKAALVSYINQIKFPGTFIEVLSIPADTLNLSYRIYYNAQYDRTDLEATIEQIITLYLQNIVFNGKIINTQITDELQKITGIFNPVFLSSEAKNYSESEYEAYQDQYQSLAGYVVLNDLQLEFIEYV